MKQIRNIFILSLALCLPLACSVLPQKAEAPATPAASPDSVTLEVEAPPKTVTFTFAPPAETERATAIPVPTDTPTPTPSATPEPTPAPTATPVPTPTPEPITFTASLDMPLPSPGTQIQKGRPFAIDGLIHSEAPLVRVWATVTEKGGGTVIDTEQVFKASQNVTEYALLDRTFSRSIDCLSENIKFQNLEPGSYTLHLGAEDSLGNALPLAETGFAVTNERWLTLEPNNLRGNYTTALAFFGSPEKFLFRYRTQSGSTHITVDPDWREKYDAEAIGVGGKKWRCHIDAVPYFEQAARYIDNTYIHISGKKLDTGAVRLADLVTFNGTIVRRFTNSNLFVSHHSFGTAVDINAYYPSHRDVLENRAKIYKEVHENLIYNGITTVDGKQCYDFTYTGTAKAGLCKVPEPLMNYLLYELGFFRAGFSWGVYYPHTSDAMHFTLTELSPSLFTDGEYAMRKVFTYLEDGAAEPTDAPEPTETTDAPETPEATETAEVTETPEATDAP